MLTADDPKGLEYLFNMHYEFLVKTAYYLTFDKQVAEDQAQDVLVKIWERRHNLPTDLNFKGYLFRMVRNNSLDYLKQKNSGDSHLERFLYFTQDPIDTPDHPEELIKNISAAMSSLPPKCRLIFSLNRFEGLTNDEIAGYLKISKRTVETQISKALRLLRTELKDLWNQGFMIFF